MIGGLVAIFVAFTIPIILVVAAFAIDYGYVVSVQAELRTASDASALAAVVSVDDEATAQATALEYAAKNMPVDANGTVLTESDIILGHWSTSSSTFSAGDLPINAIQVTTRRSSANGNAVDLFFGPLVSVPTFDVQSKTVAALLSTSEDGVFCFIALSSPADDAMAFSTTDTQFDNCGIISNSSSESALSFGGASQVHVTNAEVAVVGGIEISGKPDLEFENTATTGASSISDPVRDIDVPTFSGCDNGPSPAIVVADTTFSPGVYCGGLSVAGNAAVDFEPGIYIILDGDLRFQGSSEIIGDEVTFVFTGTTASAG